MSTAGASPVSAQKSGTLMDPYIVHQALSVLEAHTITPADANERAEVLRSFAVLDELARLYREATLDVPQD
jgi:hypothetical protein